MADPRKDWNSELEDGFPDSRLSWASREDKMIKIGRLEYERVYCASCGSPGGAVTPQFFAHVFYVCDGCATKLGPPGGLVQINEEDHASMGII
jgi:hypothetical protein